MAGKSRGTRVIIALFFRRRRPKLRVRIMGIALAHSLDHSSSSTTTTNSCSSSYHLYQQQPLLVANSAITLSLISFLFYRTLWTLHFVDLAI